MQSVRRRQWLFLGAAGALGLAGCSRPRVRAQPVPAGADVVALGDSLTFGTGASPDTAYPAVLAGLTGFAGTALMGDGSVLMILNPKELA